MLKAHGDVIDEELSNLLFAITKRFKLRQLPRQQGSVISVFRNAVRCHGNLCASLPPPIHVHTASTLDQRRGILLSLDPQQHASLGYLDHDITLPWTCQ